MCLKGTKSQNKTKSQGLRVDEGNCWVSGMAQWVKAFAVRSHDLSLITGITVKGENILPQTSTDCAMTLIDLAINVIKM